MKIMDLSGLVETILSKPFVDTLILSAISILMAFGGSYVGRMIISLGIGGALGYVTFTFMFTQTELFIAIITSVFAFLLGLALGLIIFRPAISLALGYVAASIARYFVNLSPTITIKGAEVQIPEQLMFGVLVVFFALIGYIMSYLSLALATAILGGLILFYALYNLTQHTLLSSLFAGLIALAGFAVQSRRKAKKGG